MIADVPVGVLLSGGVDSSLIVGLLAEAGQKGLQTFSVGFEEANGEKGDEFVYSDLIARHYDTGHHKIFVPSADLMDVAAGHHRRDVRADGVLRQRRLLSAEQGSFQACEGGAIGAGRRRGVRRLSLVSPAAAVGRSGGGLLAGLPRSRPRHADGAARSAVALPRPTRAGPSSPLTSATRMPTRRSIWRCAWTAA